MRLNHSILLSPVIGLFLSAGAAHAQRVDKPHKPNPDRALSTAISDFACTSYNGMVSFEKAKSFGTPKSRKHAVETLKDILDGRGPATCPQAKTIAVQVLSAIGTDNAVKTVIDYVKSGKGTLSYNDTSGKEMGVLALGWAANQENAAGKPSGRAVEFLKWAMNLESWKNLKWYDSLAPQITTEILVNRAIMGGGLSGRSDMAQAFDQNPICQPGTHLESSCKASKQIIGRLSNPANGGLAKMYPGDNPLSRGP